MLDDIHILQIVTSKRSALNSYRNLKFKYRIIVTVRDTVIIFNNNITVSFDSSVLRYIYVPTLIYFKSLPLSRTV